MVHREAKIGELNQLIDDLDVSSLQHLDLNVSGDIFVEISSYSRQRIDDLSDFWEVQPGRGERADQEKAGKQKGTVY